MTVVGEDFLNEMVDVTQDASVVVLWQEGEQVLVGDRVSVETLTAAVGGDVDLVDQLLWEG